MSSPLLAALGSNKDKGFETIPADVFEFTKPTSKPIVNSIPVEGVNKPVFTNTIPVMSDDAEEKAFNERKKANNAVHDISLSERQAEQAVDDIAARTDISLDDVESFYHPDGLKNPDTESTSEKPASKEVNFGEEAPSPVEQQEELDDQLMGLRLRSVNVHNRIKLMNNQLKALLGDNTPLTNELKQSILDEQKAIVEQVGLLIESLEQQMPYSSAVDFLKVANDKMVTSMTLISEINVDAYNAEITQNNEAEQVVENKAEPIQDEVKIDFELPIAEKSTVGTTRILA